MSEMLWNIIGVTLIGSIILFVRKLYGDKIHPQILTGYWIVFLIISLLPLFVTAELGAAVGDIGLVPEIKYVTVNRRNDYLRLADKLLSKEYGTSVLNQYTLKEMLIASCRMVWITGFILNVMIRVLREIRLKKQVKEECIGIHSRINLSERNNINVFITENIGPMVYGIKPSIYVPKKFIETDVLESILLHEKAHIIRKHHLVLIILQIASSLYWFLPYYEHVFLKCLREDMEYRCDYEVIQNDYMNPKEYALHFTMVKGCQSGLKVSLHFGEGQFAKRIHRILDFEMSREKTKYNAVFLGITAITCILWLTSAYLWQDVNGLTKWEVKQAKRTVVNLLNAANEGDEEGVMSYIYEPGPLGEAIASMQSELYHIEYQAAATSYYEKAYREQHKLQEEDFIYLEGIIKLKGSDVIWGFGLIFDEADDTWKLYDWGVF